MPTTIKETKRAIESGSKESKADKNPTNNASKKKNDVKIILKWNIHIEYWENYYKNNLNKTYKNIYNLKCV